MEAGESQLQLRLAPAAGSPGRQRLDAALADLRSQAKQAEGSQRRQLWRQFFLLRDSFARVGPAAVLTVHRSQGSSFGDVFVAPDVYWPQQEEIRRQLVYVAVSRARRRVWLVGFGAALGSALAAFELAAAILIESDGGKAIEPTPARPAQVEGQGHADAAQPSSCCAVR